MNTLANTFYPNEEMSLASSVNPEIGVDDMLATEEGLVALTVGDLEIFSKLLVVAIDTANRCVNNTEDTLFTRDKFAEIVDYQITLKRVSTLLQNKGGTHNL